MWVHTAVLEDMRARMTDMETSLEHHKRLVARLEEDLLVAGGGGVGSSVETAPDDGQHAMVKVLSSQRDRLRTRCQQLEEEAHAVGSALAKVVLAVSVLLCSSVRSCVWERALFITQVMCIKCTSRVNMGVLYVYCPWLLR